jgi:hypothetical protein
MLDLKKFSSCPVTLFKKYCDKGIHLNMLKQLVNDGNAKVFSVYENEKTATYLHSYFQLSYPEIKTTHRHSSEEFDICFTNFEETKNILLENINNTNVDFCNVLIINDIHFDHPEKIYLIMLWLQIFRVSKTRPYLLITTDSYLIPEIPFNLERVSLQEVEKGAEDVSIQYHNEDFSPNSSKLLDAIVEVTDKLNSEYPVEKEETSMWLVFYSGKGNVNFLSRNLYDTLKNTNVYSYKNITSFDKVIVKGKRSVVIIDEFYEDNMFLIPDGIIDGMVSENGNSEDRLYYTYSSKQHSEIKSSYLKKGFCYRMCTEDLYQNLPKTETGVFSKRNLEKYYLEVAETKTNLHDFFLPMLKRKEIDTSLERLRFLNLLTVDNKITKIGRIVRKFPLNATNGSILSDWIEQDKPIFPMIVLLTFMELNLPMLYFSKKEIRNLNDEKKTQLVNEYFKMEYSTPIELYLKIFVMIISVEGTIDIQNYNYICKKYNLNFAAVKEIFQKIRFVVDALRKETTIGVFNVDNLIFMARDLLQKYYPEKIGNLVNQERGLYSFKNGDVYKLDFQKHFGKKQVLPVKILALEMFKINDIEESLQKYRNVIFYYIPLDDIYVEN